MHHLCAGRTTIYACSWWQRLLLWLLLRIQKRWPHLQLESLMQASNGHKPSCTFETCSMCYVSHSPRCANVTEILKKIEEEEKTLPTNLDVACVLQWTRCSAGWWVHVRWSCCCVFATFRVSQGGYSMTLATSQYSKAAILTTGCISTSCVSQR